MIEQQIGQNVSLEVGRSGEFSVWVAGKKVAEKTYEGFPDEAECLDSVREALGLS